MRTLLIILVALLIKTAVFSLAINPGEPITICQGGSHVLTVTSTPSVIIFQWQEGDSHVPSATSFSSTVNTGGNYANIGRWNTGRYTWTCCCQHKTTNKSTYSEAVLFLLSWC